MPPRARPHRSDAAPRVFRGDGLDAELDPSFLPAADADRLFATLTDTIDWRQDTIRIFGRAVPIPRLQAWHGEPGASYTYSGLRMDPAPWTPALAEIRDRLRERLPGAHFDSALLNLYRDGHDSMGWHSDDEPELGPEPVIASVSLGAVRRFRLRHRTRKDVPTVEIDLGPGSLLVMRGTTQREWQHSLPKRTGRNDPGARINLTFRRIVRAEG